MSELQKRLRRFDRERGWDGVRPEHTLLHLLEELGEVARELLREVGYKEGEVQLTGELADVGLLLYKLADQLGIDLEAAMLEKLAANEARFPLPESREAMARYLERNDED